MRLRHVEYKWLVATAFVFGLFMDLLDLTIVNVALPTLGRQFNVSNATTLEWVVTGYLLSLAVWIPASGWLGDRFGTKRVFLFALAMFTLASVLCGLSQNVGQLIAFRILQGVGGGMLTPVGTAMLYRAFPPDERAKAAVVLTVPTVIAPAIGPILGGFLVDDVSWRWIFYVNLPIGIAGFIFTWIFVREHREENAGKFDVLGFLLSGGGLALVLYALSEAPNKGWTSGTVLATGLSGIVCFVLLVVVELRLADPMLDLRLFADRMFRNANIALFAAIGTLLGVLFLLPLFLQNLRHLTAIETGILLFPQALGAVVFAALAGRLYPTVGPRRLVAASLVLFAVTSALFLLVDLQTNLWWVAGIMLLRGFAMAFTFIPLQAATFATISAADTGRASAIFNTNRQVGSSFGVAILATVLASRATTHIADAMKAMGGSPPVAAAPRAASNHGLLLAFHDAFFAAAIIGVIGIGFAFLIHDEDAHSTMTGAPGKEGEPVLRGNFRAVGEERVSGVVAAALPLTGDQNSVAHTPRIPARRTIITGATGGPFSPDTRSPVNSEGRPSPEQHPEVRSTP
jgi:EmrB/QacA subfamily drug resistance transporter